MHFAVDEHGATDFAVSMVGSEGKRVGAGAPSIQRITAEPETDVEARKKDTKFATARPATRISRRFHVLPSSNATSRSPFRKGSCRPGFTGNDCRRLIRRGSPAV